MGVGDAVEGGRVAGAHTSGGEACLCHIFRGYRGKWWGLLVPSRTWGADSCSLMGARIHALSIAFVRLFLNSPSAVGCWACARLPSSLGAFEAWSAHPHMPWPFLGSLFLLPTYIPQHTHGLPQTIRCCAWPRGPLHDIGCLLNPRVPPGDTAWLEQATPPPPPPVSCTRFLVPVLF